MRIKLNNKSFTATADKSHRLKFKRKNINKSDILFFNEWSNKGYNPKTGELGMASDYKLDIELFDEITTKLLKGCFPIINYLDDRDVEISYDYFIITN